MSYETRRSGNSSSSHQGIAIAPRMMTDGHQLDAVLAGALAGRIGRVKLLLR